MPKYLLQVQLNTDGVKGVIAQGGTARRAAATKAVESVGGKVEAFYFAFGGTDVFVIADMPDDESAAALAMTVSASGRLAANTVVLLTPEQIDVAVKKPVDFSPPGG